MSHAKKGLAVECATVDMATGEVVKTETVQMMILPPARSDVCQDCGVPHPPDHPHDATKLHYQYTFRALHDRWPTWTDAMAHCAPEVREATCEALLAHGIDVLGGQIFPSKEATRH